MPSESDPKKSKLLIFGFAIPFCLILALGLLLYRASLDNITAMEWLKHTYEVADLIEATQGDLVDAETGSRGFLLTGNDAYLEPYRVSMQIIDSEVHRLEKLTPDNPVQLANIQRLKQLIAKRFDQLKDNIEARRKGGLEAALPLVMEGRGKSTMDQIRNLMAGMKAEEQRLLAVRNAKLYSITRVRHLLSVAIVIIGVAFLAATILLMLRLQRMQNLVRVCAWTGKVEFEGKWMSLEQYLKARFGSKITHGMSDEAVRIWSKEVEQLGLRPKDPPQ